MLRQKIYKPHIYLLCLLLFIFGDILCENYVFRTFDTLSPCPEFFLFLGLLILQIIAAPIQSAFSDFYCRKKSLIVALFFSLITILMVFLYNIGRCHSLYILIILALIKGSLGNTIPIAWAGIADTQRKNFRFSFGLSTAAYAVGYLLLILADFLFSSAQASLITMIFFIVLIYFCVVLFKDIRDQDIKKKHLEGKYALSTQTFSPFKLVWKEIHLVIVEIKKSYMCNALITFFLWEVSLYSILLLYADFKINAFCKIAISMMCGYLTGIVILKFVHRWSDQLMIKLGYLISIFSLVPFFLLIPFYQEGNLIFLAICYFFHAIGNAFLCPTLFAMLAKRTKPHDQGKIYGLIESSDTCAFLISALAVMFYNFAKLHFIYIISFSFIIIAISWIPYIRFEKSRPKKAIHS